MANQMIKHCVICGKAVGYYRSKFCGDVCARIFRNANKRSDKHKVKNQCSYCSEEFWHCEEKKYCSKACRYAETLIGNAEYSCDQCGKSVRKIPGKNRDGSRSEHVFCDRNCYDKFRTEQRGFCINCGNRLPTMSSNTRKYCSWECRLNHKRPKPKNCVNCGCLFSAVKPMRRSNGWKYTAVTDAKTCSKECHLAWNSNNEDRKRKISVAFKGQNHPLWMGGKSAWNNLGHRGSDWKKIREKAIKRDKFKCVDCGVTREEHYESTGKDLEVDHVIPFHNFKTFREANKLSNLQTRCRSCHAIVEHTRTNVQMMLPLGGHRSGHKGRPRGERHARAKMTDYQARQIYDSYHKNDISVSKLAQDYGVSKASIRCLVQGKTWRHLRLSEDG